MCVTRKKGKLIKIWDALSSRENKKSERPFHHLIKIMLISDVSGIDKMELIPELPIIPAVIMVHTSSLEMTCVLCWRSHESACFLQD